MENSLAASGVHHVDRGRAPAQSRLRTIAELAVRMRETVRRLSEEWNASGEPEAVVSGVGEPPKIV